MRVSVVATGIGELVTSSMHMHQQARPTVAAPTNDAFSVTRPVTNGNVFSAFYGFNQNATQSPTPTYAESAHESAPDQNRYQQTETSLENFEEASETPSATAEEYVPEEITSKGFAEHMQPIEHQVTEKKRSPSLFERFTGVSRKTSQQGPMIETNFQQQTTQKKDDLIDIPAFLRRGG